MRDIEHGIRGIALTKQEIPQTERYLGRSVAHCIEHEIKIKRIRRRDIVRAIC